MMIDVRPLRPEPRPDTSSRSNDPIQAGATLARHAVEGPPSPDDPGVLREALAIGDVGCWSWNTKTNGFAADCVARRLWFLPEDGALTVDAVRAAIHPDDFRMVQISALETSKSGRECHITFRLCRPEGGMRW